MLKNNEIVTLEIIFAPNTNGMHVDKLFIVCDNFSVKTIDILGDAVLFDENYADIHQVFIFQ